MSKFENDIFQVVICDGANVYDHLLKTGERGKYGSAMFSRDQKMGNLPKDLPCLFFHFQRKKATLFSDYKTTAESLWSPGSVLHRP